MTSQVDIRPVLGYDRWVWALDMIERPIGSGNWVPERAHLVVGVYTDLVAGEVRVTECGAEYTAANHPRGWWQHPRGKVPEWPGMTVHCQS